MKMTSWEQIKAILRSIGSTLNKGIADAADAAHTAQEEADEAKTAAKNAQTTADAKMNAENPVCTGSFSMNRLDSSIVGEHSVAIGYGCKATVLCASAEGYATTATGQGAHAEGGMTKASGSYAHAEGYSSAASGYYAHAEGDMTTASGISSHAEGDSAKAKAEASHAEGRYTIASSECQHVQGRYNVEDADGAYAHIVGNGEAYNTRSNAHTLDWNGNGWYAGSVYVGGTSQDDAKRLATAEELCAAAVGSVIPEYWREHLEERAAQIRAAMAAAGANKSAFFFYSDSHYSYSFKASPMLLGYLTRHTPVNRTIFGGDIVSAEGEDEATMAYLWDWRSAVRGLPNHHSVPGNHDDGNETDNRWDDAYIYAFLQAAEETPDVKRGDSGLYYSIDAPAEKTRYLYLDTATYDGRLAADAAQQAWLKNTLLTTPDGWHIVAAAHIWRDTDYTVDPPVPADWNSSGKWALEEFDAYNARTGDYAECTGFVELCVGGHTHVDGDYCSDGGIPVLLMECDSRYVRSGLDCTQGTTTEAAVSAVIADYANGKVSVIRIGRGESRNANLAQHAEPAGYTNQLRISTDTDGTIYNGKGFKENARISTTTQAETEAEGWCLTGCIPAKRGDVIRMKNVTFLDINSEASADRAQIYFYLADYTYDGNSDAYSPEYLMSEAWNAVYGENGDVVQFTFPTSYGAEKAFIRICAKHIDENSVITVNEEID